MRARQFVLRTHYSMYRRCPQRWRIATVATDTPPNLLPVQGLYTRETSSRSAFYPCAAFARRLVHTKILSDLHSLRFSELLLWKQERECEVACVRGARTSLGHAD